VPARRLTTVDWPVSLASRWLARLNRRPEAGIGCIGCKLITGSAASPSPDRGGATGLTGREAPGPSASPAGRAPAVGVEWARELSLRDAAERPRTELRGDAPEPLAGVDAPSCAGGLSAPEARNSARGR